MQEAFLHYIWKLHYFNPEGLETTCGLPIEIINNGQHNLHAGPDFSNAYIKIGEIFWAGNVEIHVHSIDWYAHKHQNDNAYNNVILHVVWEDKGKKAVTAEKVTLPVLELKPLVNPELIYRFEMMLKSEHTISCAGDFHLVPEIHRNFMLERVLVERLEKKANFVLALLYQNNTDWEETTYQLLMQRMGFKVNDNPFLELAKILPYRILRKHDNLIQIESLLFGQAGFLDDDLDDEYFKKLKKEYCYLAAKYKFKTKRLNKNQWKFMRLRPVNFPTIRLGQIAALLFQHKKLFDLLTNQNDPLDIVKLFEVKQSDYWLKHYQFGRLLHSGVPVIGKTSRELLLINVVVPLLVARSKYLDKPELASLGFKVLSELKAENNHIIKKWKSIKSDISNAYESQAYMELIESYCKKNQCLQCRIGHSLLGKNK